MKPLQAISSKRPSKTKREQQVLFGLISHYIQHGKAVGSNTLKESEFNSLSSATIRNYFMRLEKAGYLEQLHSSAGRIPTEAAYKLYAQEFLEAGTINEEDEKSLRTLKSGSRREIHSYLQNAAEMLSKLSNYAVFLSAPRFDHDFVNDIKLVAIDQNRCLCILITDFGVIKTEILYTESKLSTFSLKRLESYFQWRLTEQDEPNELDEEELQLAQKFYNEVMVRYIVGYSNFSDEDLYQTGFSQLLKSPEFSDASTLASGLALFESPNSMRHILKECSSQDQLKYWIGKDLKAHSPATTNCSVLAIPYYINKNPVGAIAILGPTRLPYRQLFGQLRVFSQYVSEALTNDIYKFKISFRQPQTNSPYLEQEESAFIEKNGPILLEDQSK